MPAPDTTPADPSADPIVTVFNRGTNNYQHGQYMLKPGNPLDVPKSVADIWCGCTEQGRPAVVLLSDMPGVGAQAAAAVSVVQAALDAEKAKSAALQLENADLLAKKQAELDGLQKLLEGLTAPKPASAPAAAAPDGS